jgi:hypothetical protein
LTRLAACAHSPKETCTGRLRFAHYSCRIRDTPRKDRDTKPGVIRQIRELGRHPHGFRAASGGEPLNFHQPRWHEDIRRPEHSDINHALVRKICKELGIPNSPNGKRCVFGPSVIIPKVRANPVSGICS